MKTMKKAMSLLLALVMLIAMLPTGVFAAYQDEYSDFPTGWSKVAMEAAVDNGLLNGFTDGTIKPQANLTRAEMAAIITRAFNAKTKADISAFVDVNPNAWYYDYIAKAVKMGALNGKSSTMMYPDTPITREEVFTAVARVLVLSSENTSALNRYNDKEEISAWALKSMSALAERGYVNGDDLGNAKPKANITREEFAQFMYNTIRTYITKEGTYTKDLEGITVLRVGNVILENFDNTSDLVLGDGVGEDPVRITNVNVEKRLLARGGRITLQNTTVTEGVVVNNVNGITYFNNYRTEKVFDGIIENTEARFKERESGGGSPGAPTIRYEVKFYFDGELIDSETIRDNKKLGSSFPDAPIGYIITGWEDEHGNPITADTVITGPIDVHAVYDLIEYDLYFVDKDGNTFAPDDSFNIEDANILPDPADVDMSGYLGYSFGGWKDANTGVTVSGDEDLKNLLTTTTEDITLEAVFTLNQYPIAFKNEDGTAFTDWADGFTPDLDYDIETPYVFPAPDKVSRLGYTFNGWTDEAGTPISLLEVTSSSDVNTPYIIKADFTPHTYNISYVLETGASFKAGYTAPTTYGPEDDLSILPTAANIDPADDRYFLYWKIAGTSSAITELPVYTIDNVSIILEAVFDDEPPEEYTVTFVVDGVSTPVQVTEGTSIGTKMPADPEKLGWTFDGWYSGTTPVTSATEVNGPMTVDATFRLNEYNIKYEKVNGTALAFKTTPEATFDIVNTYTLPVAADLDELGWTFVKWTDKATGVDVTNYDALKALITDTMTEAEGVTLVAELTLNIYPIEFRNDDNTVFTDWADGFVPDLTYDVTTPYVLPAPNNVSRLGYTLTGWKDSIGNTVTSVTVTEDSSMTDAYVLKPIFTPHTYNITYEFEVGAGFKTGYTAPVTYQSGDALSILPTSANIDPAEDRYFLYWKLEGESTQITELPLFDTDGTTIKLIAVFDDEEPEEFTVTFVVDGVSTPVQVTEGTSIGTKMPADPEKLGWTFDGWYSGTTPVTSATEVNGPMTVNATFRLNEYNIKYEKVNGTAVTFKTAPESTFDIENEYTLPVAANVDELGYTFVKWTDKATGVEVNNYAALKALITDTMTETEGVTLVAELTLNTYSIVFKNEDNTTFTGWADGFTPDLDYDIETPYVLPGATDVKVSGYTFNGWKDADGNTVTSVTVTASSSMTEPLVLIPRLTKHRYNIYYILETGASFKSGYTAPTTYEPGANISILPTEDNIVPATGRYFYYWVNNATGTQLTELPVFDTDNSTLVLRAVFGDEEPNTSKVTFVVDGVSTSISVTNNTAIGTKMPDNPKKLGWRFTGWKDAANNSVTSATVVTGPITATATFRLNEYSIKYEKEDGTAVTFKTAPESTFDIENEYTLPTATDVNELGYTFVKWTLKGTSTVISDYDGLKALITATMTEEEGVTLVAELDLNEYSIIFKNEDNTTFTDWATGFVPELTYNVEETYTLPEADDVKVLGYTLAGWMDKNGDEVTVVEVTATSSMTEPLVLYPILEENEYYIEYVFETGADFVSGYTAPDRYGPNDTTAIIPGSEKIAPADGRYFLYWIDQATGSQLTTLPIYEVNGTTLYLEAVFDDVPPTLYTVRFFEGYNQDEFFLLGKLDDVVSGTCVAEGDIPSTDGYERTGHVKNSSIASVYATEETHIIKPTYWYVDDTNKLVPFTSEVEIVEDTDVYLLYKNFTTYMSISDEEFSVTASYEHSTRLLNSVKDMALGTRQQLEKALQLDIISGLDEKALDKLIAANILDGGKNIQKINLPIAIGKFVKRETINGSIKQFIRDTIKDDAKLDSILDMIDIDQFIEEININQMVKDMTDEELRDLIKGDYKDEVIDFVLKDLKKTDSKMLDAVVDHIMSDADYKNELIEEIIAKLKTGTAENTIIEFIKTSDNLLDMVITALKNKDATLMPTAVSHIKTTLGADTTDGASLRKTVLTSNKLKDILMEASIKAKLLGMLTDKEFVNKAMQNHDFRVEMVEAIIENDHFLEKLVETDIFTKYVVDNLHHGDLKNDIISLLTSSSTEATKFRNKIIEEIKKNDTFLNLIKEGGALRNDIIKFSDFVTDEDNFVKYVFGQLSGQALADAQSKYSFITQAEIEKILEDEYSEYKTASPADKQSIKDEIFNNEYSSAKSFIITEATTKFNSYKLDILDKLEDKEEITDDNVNNIINELLVEHTTKYINKDHSLNHDEEMAIEYVLVHYIGDVLTGKSDIGVNGDITDHIDALITNLLSSDDEDDMAKVIAVIDEYIEDFNAEAQGILGEETTYAQVVDKLVTLVQATGSTVYTDVDKMLKDNIASVSDTLIADFIAQNADSAELRSSIKSYISGMANATIATHIKNFMTDATIVEGSTETKGEVNTAKVRTEINNYLTAAKIREYAEDFVKDPLNAQEVKDEVTNFIENVSVQFVTDNRTTIEDALTDMDLSGLVDKETVKDHIKGLSPEEKQNFADKIYNTLIKTENVKTFIDSLLNEKTFDITEDNLSIIKAIAEALRSFEYEDVMKEINNATLKKVIDVVGEDFIEGQFNKIIGDYCDGLDEVIAEVETDGVTRQYTTSLTVIVDIINDLYIPLYDKAQSKVENKIQNVFGIDFYKNPYIKFLVEDDITARLFDGGSEYETEESTGYAIKEVLDYYDYLYMLLLVADDAACWFGIDENVSDEEIDAIYEAMIGKMLIAHGKVNEIIETYLEEDELPAKVESLLKSVQQLNNAFVKVEPTLKKVLDKYLKSSINESLENGDVPGVEKGEKLIDILIGQEEPVVNIDTIYNVFYYYDDTVQEKLAEIIESDKFKKAVDKFENTDIGDKFKGYGRFGTLADRLDEIKNSGKVQGAFDSIYDLLVTVSQYGLEPFRIEKDVITTEDAYKVEVGSVVIIIKRYYE